MKECQFDTKSGMITGLTNAQSGPIVLALHGFLDNAESLACLGPYFDGYQFIAIDLPGHGKSFHRPVGAHYHQIDFVQDLYQLIAEQGWTNVILVGHSLGGIIASIFAACFPEVLKAVAMIDACGPLTLESSTSVEQIRASVLSRSAKLAHNTETPAVDVESAVAARCKITDITAESARKILLRNIGSDHSGKAVWQSDPRLRTKSTLRLTSAQAEAIVRDIRVPVWIGGATDSFKQLPETYEQRKYWFQQSYFESFSGGHHFHMTSPSAVSASIKKFVEDL